VLSNVISTSIVAVGASIDFDFKVLARFGAKAEERRPAIFSFDHVVVILSGKSLFLIVSTAQAMPLLHGRSLRILHDKHIILLSQAKQHAALDELLLPRLAQPIGIT